MKKCMDCGKSISNVSTRCRSCNGQKKIIELYGDYWHNREEVIERDKRRLKSYKKYGYETLIVWENELNDLCYLKNKIHKFNKSEV